MSLYYDKLHCFSCLLAKHLLQCGLIASCSTPFWYLCVASCWPAQALQTSPTFYHIHLKHHTYPDKTSFRHYATPKTVSCHNPREHQHSLSCLSRSADVCTCKLSELHHILTMLITCMHKRVCSSLCCLGMAHAVARHATHLLKMTGLHAASCVHCFGNADVQLAPGAL